MMNHPSVEELFGELVDLPVNERTTALDALGLEDGPLRSELIRLLRDAEAADAYFTGTAVAVKMLPSHRIPLPPVEVEGEMVGPYRLVRKLGTGGFGVVWQADQVKPLRRTVALKILKAGMDSAEVLARFDAEKQALARMDHLHIAKVLDAGMTESGRSYFAMELVEGCPVTQFCEDNTLSTRERLKLFMDVCAAVNHAHQKGVIHRDLKPSNVLVSRQDSGPVVKVIDFGIAKAIEGDLTDQTLLTRAEQWIGTPIYMSPEQMGMGSVDLDTRSDIYALGVILYELITGCPPFDSETLMRAGYDEMRRIIREEDPPRPSARITTRQDNPQGQPVTIDNATGHALRSIKSELDWIVMKAIEKSKERRYDTAAALADDLGRFLADEPISAKPPSSGYLIAKFARRHRAVLLVISAVAVMLVGATGFSSYQAVRASKAEKLAREMLAESIQERNAKEVALKNAEGVSLFLTDVFTRPTPEADGRNITMVDALDAATAKLEKDLADQPLLKANLMNVLADTYEKLGVIQKVIELRRKELGLIKSRGEGSMPDYLKTANQLVSRLSHVGYYEEARDLGAEEFILREKHHGLGDMMTLQTLEIYALNTFRSGDYPKAIDLQEKLVRNMMTTLQNNDPRLSEAKKMLMAFCRDSGDRERWRQLSLNLDLKTTTKESPESLEERRKNLQGLLPQKQEIFEQCERDLGKRNTRTIEALAEVAAILAELDRGDEAIEIQGQVVEDSREVYGEIHSKTLLAIEQRMNYCNMIERWDVAHQMREQAAKIRKHIFGPNYYESLHFHGVRMFSLSLINRSDDALKLADEFMPQIRRVMGPESRYYFHYSCNQARCLASAGRSHEALEIFEKCCPKMLDDTFVNLMYAGLLLWNDKEVEYEKTRSLMLDYTRATMNRTSGQCYRLDRGALICSLIPLKTPDQTRTLAAILERAEAIIDSPDYRSEMFQGPSWSKTIHGIVNYRLGNFERALQRFDEALRIADAQKIDHAGLEHTMNAIYRPLILHAMGKTEEAKRLFLANMKSIRLWDDPDEPLRNNTAPDGIGLAIFLSYKEAAKIFGVKTPK